MRKDKQKRDDWWIRYTENNHITNVHIHSLISVFFVCFHHKWSCANTSTSCLWWNRNKQRSQDPFWMSILLVYVFRGAIVALLVCVLGRHRMPKFSPFWVFQIGSCRWSSLIWKLEHFFGAKGDNASMVYAFGSGGKSWEKKGYCQLIVIRINKPDRDENQKGVSVFERARTKHPFNGLLSQPKKALPNR